MKKICEFLNSIKISDSIEDGSILTLEFDCNENFINLLDYSYVKELKELYSTYLEIFISLNSVSDINILDFTNNNKEFMEEITQIKIGKTKIKIIFKMVEFLKNKFKALKDLNLRAIYDSKHLINSLNKPLIDFEAQWSNKEKKVIFILINENINLSNKLFTVIGFENLIANLTSIQDKVKVNSEDIINIRNEYCNWIDSTKLITPNQLFTEFPHEYKDTLISKHIRKKTVDCCLGFIANFTGMQHNKYISIINGTKKVEVVYDLDLDSYSEDSYINIYKIYRWIYDEFLASKIYICRNVISILVSAKCQGSVYKTILNNSDWILESIKTNYESFITDNVNDFFNQKTKLADQLKDKVENIHVQINNTTKILVNNFTSLIGVSIAAIAGYLNDGDISLVKILLLIYLIYLDYNSLFSLPLSLVRFFQSKNDFNNNKQEYIDLYIEDSFIISVKKRCTVNSVIFWIYFVLILISIIIINIAIIVFMIKPLIYEDSFKFLYSIISP